MEINPLTQLTHEEARRLVDFSLDQALDAGTRSVLDEHLTTCMECRSYAGELDQLESVLRGMKHRWDRLRPAPLHPNELGDRSRNKVLGFADTIVATRMAVMILTVFAVALGAWQLSIGSLIPPNRHNAAIPIPTPSSLLTATGATAPGCNYIVYRVQPGDTLDGIASMFSVQKEWIVEFNHMQTEAVDRTMILNIPLCITTPTGTIQVPAATITITPQLEANSPTPG